MLPVYQGGFCVVKIRGFGFSMCMEWMEMMVLNMLCVFASVLVSCIGILFSYRYRSVFVLLRGGNNGGAHSCWYVPIIDIYILYLCVFLDVVASLIAPTPVMCSYTVCCFFVCLFVSLFIVLGGWACLCWCVPIPCVASFFLSFLFVCFCACLLLCLLC